MSNRTWEGGAIRESNDNKLRWDLIPITSMLRVVIHFTNGAKKYSPNNWQLGMDPNTFLESAERHFHNIKLGRKDEDHPAALIWNILCYMWYEEFVLKFKYWLEAKIK